MGENDKTLYLTIKPVYLQQILHGFKTSEYREKKDYYTKLLIDKETVDEPGAPEGYVRCLDGRWRIFKPYRYVHFKSDGLGEATYEIKSIDAASGVYVIRLGAQVDRKADKGTN